jgi:hypothetical protein
MLIPNEIRKCVAFVGYRDTSGTMYLAGTAFFLIHTVGEDLKHGFLYLVTAKHVIDGIRDKGCDAVFIRLDIKGGGKPGWVKSDLSRWHFHPTEPDTVDVAMVGVSADVINVADLEAYPSHRIATDEVIQQFDVGVGNEVFFPGLFKNHIGAERNIPIVRVGNIAAMLEEKVRISRDKEIDAYLVEARSIGGLSGSPVFVHLGALRLKNGQIMQASEDHGIFFLLGLMVGHWREHGITDADSVRSEPGMPTEQVNMGIGIVVPAQRVMEVVNQPKIKEAEEKFLQKKSAENSP